MSLLYPVLSGPGSRMPGVSPSVSSLAGVAAAHAAILFLLLTFVPAERLAELARPLTVRLIELAPEAPPPPPPKPQPDRPKPRPAPPARIVAVSTPAPVAEAPAFTVPTPPAPTPVVPVQAPTAVAAPPAPPAPITQARFDADYLKNPKPVYPATSRRLGEEGKVVLRVHVDAEGRATEIELKGSSGFPRLDAAAREAVTQWRFLPARRGTEAIAAWVLVPIVFSLEG